MSIILFVVLAFYGNNGGTVHCFYEWQNIERKYIYTHTHTLLVARTPLNGPAEALTTG